LKIIILGAGEVGFHIASRLASENKEVVVIDKDEEALKRVSDAIDVQILKGSGSSPNILIEAGLEDANIFLAVTDSDQVNLVACLFADYIVPETKKIARLRDTDYTKFNKYLKNNTPHIDTIINPDVEAVKTIERFINIPDAVDIGEFGDGKIKLIGIRLDSDCSVCGTSLINLPTIEDNSKLLIAAIIRNGKLIIPGGKDTLEQGDLVYFVCKEKSLYSALKIFNKFKKHVKRILIVGGGRVGYKIAKRLEKTSIHTRLIEKNSNQCDYLSEKLNKTIVLHGDGREHDLMLEENVKDMDLVLSLTGDEETNILVSLLAKRSGAGKTITRISKFSYFPLVEAIGIEHIVSPRLSAVNSILQHIRQENVLSAISIKGEQAEVLEAVVHETSDVVGKPLQKLSFPKGALIVGIKREDDVIIPTGSSVITPGDRIIIFTVRDAVSKVEKILSITFNSY